MSKLLGDFNQLYFLSYKLLDRLREIDDEEGDHAFVTSSQLKELRSMGWQLVHKLQDLKSVEFEKEVARHEGIDLGGS